MNEADITQMIAMNRQSFIGWLQTSLLLTLAVFFLAYVVRGVPVYVRAGIFVVFLIGSFNFFMVMNITNAGFLLLVQDLAVDRHGLTRPALFLQGGSLLELRDKIRHRDPCLGAGAPDCSS